MSQSTQVGHEGVGTPFSRRLVTAKWWCRCLLLANTLWALVALGQESLWMLAKIWQLAYLGLVLFVVRAFGARQPNRRLVVALVAASTIEGLLWLAAILLENDMIPRGMLLPESENPVVLLWVSAIPFKIITFIVFGLALAELRRRERSSTQANPSAFSK